MIKSSVIGVENKENGKVLVDGITLQSTDYTIRNNIATEVIETLDNPSIIIKSGLIESTDDAAVACFYNRTIDIQGGTIKGNKGVEIAGSGILNISNTTIEGVEYGIINNYGQVFVNEGCVIIGNNKYGITNVRNATTTVTGGIIKGNLAGIQSKEIEGLVVTTTITGGIISGNTDGVIQSQEDILVIGIDDKVVSQNTPVIIGNDVGIVTGSGTFEFYDGIIKGADKKSKSGVVTKIPDGYYIEKGTETIEGVEYETSYLAPKNYEEVTFTGTHVNYYATLVDAIANVTSGNTINPLKNMEETTSGEIIDEKTVIFDLNGYTITNPNGPVLKTNGELTITGEGTINGSADTILNEGTKTLTILSGEIF